MEGVTVRSKCTNRRYHSSSSYVGCDSREQGFRFPYNSTAIYMATGVPTVEYHQSFHCARPTRLRCLKKRKAHQSHKAGINSSPNEAFYLVPCHTRLGLRYCPSSRPGRSNDTKLRQIMQYSNTPQMRPLYVILRVYSEYRVHFVL